MNNKLSDELTPIFKFNTHFEYLNHFFKLKKAIKGIKGHFADHVRIKPAFLSQVLSKKYPLSLEQADLANQFLEHSLEESDFFILLVSLDRAGTVSLKNYYTKKIDEFRKRRTEIIERLGKKSEVSAEVQGIYYSSWAYSAVHIALTIPHLQTLKELQNFLGLSRETLLKVLNFLETHQFIIKNNNQFKTTQKWIRLDRQSPFIIKHHSNWRNKVLEHLNHQNENEIHFSGIYSLDKSAIQFIQESLLQNLSTYVKKIEKADEKELFALNLDFFNLKKSD